jgi:regulator of protease activity HflC (stomatin/prohibitin superfamily)
MNEFNISFGSNAHNPANQQKEEGMSIRKYVKYGILVVAGVIGISVLLSSFYVVNSGERAIVLTNGRVTEVAGGGLHFKTPIVQSIVRVDVRTQKAHTPAPAGTNDLQIVKTTVAVNYHLIADAVGKIYTVTGLDVEDRIIDPRIQETVKAVVAHYTAEQLLKQRDKVRGEILASLGTMLKPYNIVVEDIQITDFQFSKAFDEAIEAKQTAEQNALTERNKLESIKLKAQQAVATAQGEADSNLALAQSEAKGIELRGKAIRDNPEVLELNRIRRWDGKLPQVTSGVTPFITLK